MVPDLLPILGTARQSQVGLALAPGYNGVFCLAVDAHRLGHRAEVLDGRSSHLGDGVQRALGRPARDFADYARDTAAMGVWNLEAVAS